MASKKRERSASDFYHVCQRGVCLFDIFEDNSDREYYLEHLTKYCNELGVEIHAWCLMSNHTHLLLKTSLEALSTMMRKLGAVFARYFNARHKRSGPMFEGRFCSVCVETDEQYMTVMRYIHRNPIRHEEAALCGEYRWSSYGEHVNAAHKTCVVQFALSLFGGIDSFARVHDDGDTDKQRHLDIGASGPLGDEEARGRANAALLESGYNIAVSHIGTLPHALRNKAIACVKRSVGCSLRQLQRLTAIAYSAIRNAIREDEGTSNEAAEDNSLESPLQELAAAFKAAQPEQVDSNFAITSGLVSASPAPA